MTVAQWVAEKDVLMACATDDTQAGQLAGQSAVEMDWSEGRLSDAKTAASKGQRSAVMSDHHSVGC